MTSLTSHYPDSLVDNPLSGYDYDMDFILPTQSRLPSLELCVPPACVNIDRPPEPREDAFSTTSKGYLSTSLSSAPNG